jgi:enoyl-CoA hydratase
MSHLTTERRGPVAVCTITNPPDGLMDASLKSELVGVACELGADVDVRAVVFTGGLAGVFIRHYSVEELASLSQKLRARGMVVDPDRPIPERDIDLLFNELATMPKPVIVAINGTAMGGGCEFSLACDFRIAAEGDYEIGLPEVGIGLLPGAGGSQRLTRLLGPGRALEMMLLGRTVGPREALDMGLVHEVVPREEVVERAIAVGREIAAKPALAVAHIKKLVRSYAERPLADALAMERTLFLELLLTDEAFRLMQALNAGERDIHGSAPPR